MSYCAKCKQVRLEQIRRERVEILDKKFGVTTHRSLLIAGILEESALEVRGEDGRIQRSLLEIMAVLNGDCALVDRYATPAPQNVTP